MVIVTKQEDAVSNHTISLDEMAPCSHEEADTRIFVHARHATAEGSKVLVVKANARHSCRSNQCTISPSGDRSAPVVDCLWPRTEPKVSSCA